MKVIFMHDFIKCTKVITHIYSADCNGVMWGHVCVE